MKKNKLTKKSLEELAQVMPVLCEKLQTTFVGGGNGTQNDPYSEYEYDAMLASGSWNGGFVENWGYVSDSGDAVITGNYINNGDSGSYLPNIPIGSDIATPMGVILSITEETLNKGGIYVRVLNYGLTFTQIYNSNANMINSKELSTDEIYNIAINTIGLAGWQGAAVASIIDFYKQGFEYFVKMKVELDNYIENQFNPTSGFMYP